MAEIREVPNFEFSGFYFFDIESDIRRFWRIAIPEITEEAEESISVQLARGWALPHHILNTRMDIVANESYLPTARLTESVRLQLKLIDFELAAATPAVADMVMEFSSLFTTPTLIVPRGSQFATEDSEAVSQIIYEAVEDNSISRTDQLTHVFLNRSIDITLSNKSGNLFDFVSTIVPQEGDLILQNGNTSIVSEVIDGDTLRVNEASNLVDGAASISAQVFGADRAGEAATDSLLFNFSDAEPKAGDTIYLIHDSVMWNQIDFVMNQGFSTGIKGVWEFFDGTAEDENPVSVTNLGSNLQMDVSSLLGEEDRSGTIVRVTLAQTSSSEEVVSEFVSGVNIIRTTGLLGQISPTEIATDYTVGTIWSPLETTTNTAQSDGEFSQSGRIIFELPQTLKQNWARTTINGTSGFVLRFRVQSIEKKAAILLGTDFNAAGLDTTNYNINIQVDSFPATEIDVTNSGGTSAVTLADVVTNINNALNVVDPSLGSTASSENGQLRLTAPNSTLGKDSLILLQAPANNDATDEIFGLSESAYPHQFIGVGGDAQFDRVRIDEGKQFLLFQVVQGETVTEDPLGSSDGSPSQEFILNFSPLIEGSVLAEVDEGSGFTSYDVVDNFLNSDATSKHITRETTASGITTVQFGNGEIGKIPPTGVDNIRVTYRIGADFDQDGNVGARTIIVNLAGISFVNEIFNPRPATGFAPRQGTTPESLAQAKIEGPASLRNLGKAITTSDIEQLATQFSSPLTGSSPIVRARAIEETFGVKTVELLVVGNAGNLLNESQRTEVDEFFNGSKPKDIVGVLLTNHEVQTVNYQPRIIDIEAVVTGGNEEVIKNALIALLNPEAKFDDAVTFRFDFGDTVRTSIIVAEIHGTDRTGVKNVNLIQPAADIVLNERELPIVGNINLTIVQPGS